MRPRVITLLGLALLTVNCSSDSIAGLQHRAPNSSFTLELTSVSTVQIPAVYFVSAAGQYRSWADSGTVTVQPDGVIAFRLYESGTSPLSAPHEDQASDVYSTSGTLTSDSTFDIKYSDGPDDHGTINADGSVTLNLTGTSDNGTVMSFGTWRFATPYHGPALNPAPHVDSLTPRGVVVTSADVTVLINGRSFMPASTVSIGNTQLNTTYVSAEQLRVIIPGVMLTSAGIPDILVTNPGPGGGKYYFSFAVVTPAPTITAITPSEVTAGGPPNDITVTGTGFIGGATVTLNGVKRIPKSVASSTSLTVAMTPADLANAGVIHVAVVNPAPTIGPSASFPFTVTGTGFHVTAQVIAPSTNATLLVGDPVQPVVYAGLGPSDRTHPNSITALDGATGRALWSVGTGVIPVTLAISRDGQFLYFTTASDSSIYRVTVASASISLVTPIVHSTSCPMASQRIIVSPDNPHMIAVAGQCRDGSGGGVTIYDDSVARPQAAYIGGSFGAQVFTFGESSSVMYGTVSGALFDVAVDASGATAGTSRTIGMGGSSEVMYLHGKLYTTAGVVYDPVARTPLPGLSSYPPSVSSITASADGQTLYVLTSDRQSVIAFDLARGTFTGEVIIPGSADPRQHLVRWGTDGIAFISRPSVSQGFIPSLTGGSIHLVRTDLVHQ